MLHKPGTGREPVSVERRKSDYENRIFFRLVLLVTIPLAVLGALLCLNAYRAELTRNDLMLRSARESAQTQIESVLSNLRDYYMTAIDDDDVKWVQETAATPYSSITQLRAAQEVLRGGKYLNQYVSGYEYINFAKGWVLDNNGTFRLASARNRDEVENFLARREESYLSVEWVDNTRVPQPQEASQVVNLSGYLLVVRTSTAVGGTSGMLVVRLNLTRLATIADDWQSLGYQLALTNDDHVILTTSQALADAVSSELKRGAVTRSHGWRVATGYTSGNGLVYYAALRQDAMLSVSASTLLLTLLVGAVTLFVLALCRWTSAFLYRPIAELLDAVNLVFGQRGSDQDEFAYLATGVNRMARDQKDLQNLLVLQRRQLKEQFMQHMLRSEVNVPAIDHTLQQFSITPCRYYRLLVLAADTKSGTSMPEREALLLTVVEHFSHRLMQKLFVCPVVMNMTIVLVVGAEDENDLAANVQVVFKAVSRLMRNGFGFGCSAGVSRVFRHLDRMRNAYYEGIEALRARSAAREARSAMIYYTAAEDDEVENGYDLLLENEITAAITACNKKEASRLLQCFIDRMEDKGIRGYERQFQLQRLVTAILSVAENSGLSVNQVLSRRQDGLFDAVGKLYSNDGLHEFLLEQTAVPVMDLLTSFRRDTSSELVKNVIALIKQTGGDLTLNECAEQLNYHPSYIWKVLKAERDTNFTDLVNTQKLEMAKEMLLTTDMTVAQVAETLHYSNVQNFIRFFSREVGMPPGKYKKEHQPSAGRKS